MSSSNEEILENLKVVKRNGKKVNFDTTKVAMAIKKAFDACLIPEAEEKKYTEKDVHKVYNAVIKVIEKNYKDEEKIKIENIQDFIEESLKKNKYDDVCLAFSEYRERRDKSRELFSDEKKMHKFLKSLEGLGLKSAFEEDAKRENANIDGNSAM